MRFSFTDDQQLFRNAVRDLLAKECPPDEVRHAWTNHDGRRPELWATLGQMGVLGLPVAESYGGLGLSELDLVLLLEETGRVALPDPIVDSVAVASPLLAELAPPEVVAEWLPQLASGAAVATTTLGGPYAPNADSADLIIAARNGQVILVPAAAARRVRQVSVDGARRLFAVDWDDADGLVLATGDDARSALERAGDRGAVATAAQLRLEFARPVVYAAAYALAADDPDAARAASHAKAAASEAALCVGRQALQCHGAIGYTVEYDLHLYLKRTWALAAAWGDAAHHRSRVADLVLGPLPS
jgi:alkylation response protein AidB-like acyl-CoA dehydrogenase